MKYDYKNLYQQHTDFVNARPALKRAIPLADKLLTAFFGLVYLLLWVYVLNADACAPDDYLTVFFVPALALIIVSLLQVLIDRPRPYSENGANVQPLARRKRGGSSMPSRHAACAAALAMTFAAFNVAIGIVLFIPALLLSYIRFILGWHYPSDIAVGGGIGIACGILAFLL